MENSLKLSVSLRIVSVSFKQTRKNPSSLCSSVDSTRRASRN